MLKQLCCLILCKNCDLFERAALIGNWFFDQSNVPLMNNNLNIFKNVYFKCQLNVLHNYIVVFLTFKMERIVALTKNKTTFCSKSTKKTPNLALSHKRLHEIKHWINTIFTHLWYRRHPYLQRNFTLFLDDHLS